MKTNNFKTEKEVLSFLKKEPAVKFIRIIFPDVLGREMNFCIPAGKMASAFNQGAGFDGSSVEGFARIEESDLIIVPQANTFRVLPWQYEFQGNIWKEAVVFGEIFNSKKEHFPGDSRYLLKKTLEETKNYGQLFAGPELEFFLFENEQSTKLLDFGGYFHGGRLGEIRKAAQIYLEQMGIAPECDHHECSPSQHEINLKYNDALTIADSIILAKYIIKRVANVSGVYASFMPKPITTINGSGMHMHLSLWKGNKNLFFNNEKDPLSNTAKKYVMGLIKHGKEIQIVLNQWVNSYKRLIPGYEAPVYLAWGTKNRSAYVRVPQTSLAKAKTSTRIEIRSPDPSCNPYLALSIIQRAGISGIKNSLKFLPAQEKDIFEMSKLEMRQRNIKTLSRDLNEALSFFKKSQLTKKSLGNHLYNKIIHNKEIEWSNYKKAVGNKFQKTVSPYEIKTYLPVL